MSEKTNVMRILSQKKINYKSYSYDSNQGLSGNDVAKSLNKNENQVFKTLVTVGKSKEHYVFVIPVNKELNLKKAAKSISEKSISMIKEKELMPLTGYIHGGCSPIGMKKFFTTVINETAKDFETIIFSAGKVGYPVEVNIEDLKKVIKFKLDDIV